MSLVYNLDDLRSSWIINFNGPVHETLRTPCWIWYKARSDGYGTGTSVNGKQAKAYRAVNLPGLGKMLEKHTARTDTI